MASIARLKRGEKLLIATHNAGKLAEFRELFTPLGLVLISAADLGLPEPEETGTTFVENARLKAHAAAGAAGMVALADDSGMAVEALGGEPGVYTADWAQTPTGRDYQMAMRRVEDRLQAIGASSPGLRKGSFNATLCLAAPDGRDDLYVGQVAGTMVWPPRGDKGFGFDPIFMPDGGRLTFGEMEPDAKHAISHRADAFRKLVAACFA